MNEPPYEELVRQWKMLASRDGLALREVACVNAPRTLLLADIVRPGKPWVAISAGVHGDEPAAPWALLSLVRDGLLGDAFSYRLWPCTNPSGYRAGTRANAEGADINRSFSRGGTTPESRAIVTANRDRTFALALDLHEDYEADGFYCYEPLVYERPDRLEPALGAGVVQAIEDAGLPVQETWDAFDLGYPSEANDAAPFRRLERGRVLPDAEREAAFFEGLPYTLYLLLRAGAPRTLTLESPRKLPWSDRLAVHRIGCVAALARLEGLEV